MASITPKTPPPGGGGFLEIDVALGALVEPVRAEGLEPRIEVAAALAVTLVVRVAQREHGEMEPGRRGLALGVQLGMESPGVRGRLAVAEGAGEDEDVFLGGQVGGVEAVEAEGIRLEAARLRGPGDLPGQRPGIPGLAAEEDAEPGARRHGLGRGRGRKEPGEKAIEPGALRGGERRALGDEGARIAGEAGAAVIPRKAPGGSSPRSGS